MASVSSDLQRNERSTTSDPLFALPPRKLQYPTFPAWGLLHRAAGLMPDRDACIYYETRWQYRQLNRDAMRLAAVLQDLEVRPGDRVGVLLPNVPEYIIAVNGIWRVGGIAVAISPLMVSEEVDSLLAETDCQVVISLDMLSHTLCGSHRPRKTLLVSVRPQLGPLEQLGYLYMRHRRTGQWWMPGNDSAAWFWDELNRAEPLFDTAHCDPATDAAYILPTGGTTGQPKAVTLSHRNLVANAWQQYYWAGAQIGRERLTGVLPFFHSYGLSTTVLGGAAMIATIVLHHRFNTYRTIELMQRHRPTVFHAVPAMLVAMNEQLRKRPARLDSIKWVISGGAPLPPEVASEFAEHTGALVVEGYGLSEASPVTHVGPLNATARHGTIGLPLPDTDARIVDPETGTIDLPQGEIGELVVRGPQVMLGYWNDPVETQRTIRDGWLFTGDLARIRNDGLFEIQERKKDLIITSGFNVFPREVERKLRGFPGVHDAAVVGVPDAQRGETVKAFLVMEKGAPWDEAALDAYCNEHLSAHKRPRIFERCEHDLPRNFLGKVLRRHLREGEMK
ncbi:AMP-binding protein [Rosistilla oblonga]|uniref:AMP-binding protein n=1 Tax=Rosistilla oblonga TaxID=2527990 RepID=UPI003A970B80